MSNKFWIAAFFAGSLSAAPAETAKSHPVPIELESEYNRADAALSKIMARPEIVSAQSDANSAAAAIMKFCGDKASPVQEGKHYVCVDKAESPKADAAVKK